MHSVYSLSFKQHCAARNRAFTWLGFSFKASLASFSELRWLPGQKTKITQKKTDQRGDQWIILRLLKPCSKCYKGKKSNWRSFFFFSMGHNTLGGYTQFTLYEIMFNSILLSALEILTKKVSNIKISPVIKRRKGHIE